MIDQIDARLVRWVTSVLRSAGESSTPMLVGGVSESDKTVQIVLTDVRPAPPARGNKAADIQIRCSYLVVVSLDDPAESHRVLGLLLVAALDAPRLEGCRLDLEVDPFPPTAEWWAAAKARPQPSLTLVLRERKPREISPVNPVRGPLEVVRPATTVVSGAVVAFDNIPVVGAEVTVPPFPAIYRTDRHGRFQTAPVPVGENGVLLQARAKGLQMDITVQPGKEAAIVFETLGQPRTLTANC